MPGVRKHGLMESEQEVVDLLDDGVPEEDIVARLGRSRSFVRNCAFQFSFQNCWRAGDRAHADAREACQRHAAAIAATGKRYA